MTAHALEVGASRRRVARGDVLGVYRAERRKLLAQTSTRVLALVCLLGPFAFGAFLSRQSAAPADTLLGIWVHSSGYAVSLVVLGFAGYLGFPVLAGVLAGDMFSSEDRYGTWKTVLTRSVSRRDVFAGKVLAAAAFSVALVALAALSSLVAGLLFTGDQPLVGLGGTVIPAGECLWLVLVSWLLSMLPVLAFTSLALLFSVATRNGIAGVLGPVLVGLAMQLLALVGSGTWVHMLLVASAFDDWHGLLSTPRFYGPLVIGSCVSVVWILACLSASWLILRRRDFAGPPVSRRAGWVVPARWVLGGAASIVFLAAAANWGPVAITQARLEASIRPVFGALTRLQQQELGRPIPRGAELSDRTICRRRSGKSQGPGDDWTCALNIFAPQPGAAPFRETAVAYDVSVKSNGCYKAEAPSSFVGQQTMVDVHGHGVVNPLFTIYGCFDTTAPPPPCPTCATATTPPPTTRGRPGTGSTTSRPAETSARKAELKALHEAERAAGPAVMREIEQATKREARAAKEPAEEAPPPSVTK
ncbi:MAG: ABC transporter permease [Solirubrobacteraceae bacterium]